MNYLKIRCNIEQYKNLSLFGSFLFRFTDIFKFTTARHTENCQKSFAHIPEPGSCLPFMTQCQCPTIANSQWDTFPPSPNSPTQMLHTTYKTHHPCLACRFLHPDSEAAILYPSPQIPKQISPMRSVACC